jgi:hypothetical membrane protein
MALERSMQNTEYKKYQLIKGAFITGTVFIGIISAFVATNLPPEYREIYAFLCALLYLVILFLSRNQLTRQKINIIVGLSIISGLFAMPFWTFIIYKMSWGWWIPGLISGFYLMNGMMIPLLFYQFLLHIFLPEPPPEPLTLLPQNIQEVTNQGKVICNAWPAITIFVFFIISGIGLFLIGVFYKSKDLAENFFIVCLGLGFLISIISGIVATYRWQKWALQSGIPAEELKKAAKLAGLWWPDIKDKHS